MQLLILLVKNTPGESQGAAGVQTNRRVLVGEPPKLQHTNCRLSGHVCVGDCERRCNSTKLSLSPANRSLAAVLLAPARLRSPGCTRQSLSNSGSHCAPDAPNRASTCTGDHYFDSMPAAEGSSCASRSPFICNSVSLSTWLLAMSWMCMAPKHKISEVMTFRDSHIPPK